MCPGQAVRHLGDAGGPTDEGEPAVPQLEQMVHGHLATSDVVHSDGTPVVGRARRPVHEDDRHAEPTEPAQPFAGVPQRRDEDTGDTQLHQAFEILVLSCSALVRIADEQ